MSALAPLREAADSLAKASTPEPWPEDAALPALVAFHGSLAATSRALGRNDGALALRLRVPRRCAVRVTCLALTKPPSEMCAPRHGYPDDEELARLMVTTGSFNAMARVLGVRRESLRDYLRRRPELLARLKDARSAPPSVEERRERKRARGREYMRQRRLEEPNTVRVRRRLSMAGRKPLGDRPPVDPAMHAYAGILRRDPCAYCGAECEHIDHIVPVASGGELGWENLTAACGLCNRRKQRRSLLAFLREGVMP